MFYADIERASRSDGMPAESELSARAEDTVPRCHAMPPHRYLPMPPAAARAMMRQQGMFMRHNAGAYAREADGETSMMSFHLARAPAHACVAMP